VGSLPLTVICVFWKGKFRNRPYKAEWVRRLKNMVERHAPEHRFVCLSNSEVDGVETIPLKDDLPGWWSKIELFRSDLPIDGRCLYLDLDCLVVGDLNEIVEHPSNLAFCPPSYMMANGQPAGSRDHKKVIDRFNSSVIVWNTGEGCEIYDRFKSHQMDRFRGDQDWGGYCKPNADRLPAEWFGKLRDHTDGPKPDHKVILSMPWKCEEAAKRFEWVNKVWV